MRWVHLTIIALFAVVTLIFAVQNLDAVTLAFLGYSIRVPIALATLVVYVLGAVTGGSVYALLRKSIRASRPTT